MRLFSNEEIKELGKSRVIKYLDRDYEYDRTRVNGDMRFKKDNLIRLKIDYVHSYLELCYAIQRFAYKYINQAIIYEYFDNKDNESYDITIEFFNENVKKDFFNYIHEIEMKSPHWINAKNKDEILAIIDNQLNCKDFELDNYEKYKPILDENFEI